MAKETISQTEGLCKEVASCVRNAYDRGYKQGQKDMEQNTMAVLENGKMIGREEAWECARKIMLSDEDGGIAHIDIQKIFGGSYYQAMMNYSASEAIAKIKEYEEKQKTDSEVKVGDEVIDGNSFNQVKGIVTFVSPIVIYVLWYDGSSGIRKLEDIKKTGRYFGKITEVLEQLKGEI